MSSADTAPDSSTASSSALRADIRRLGDLLGGTLVRQEGQELLDLVEKVRALTRSDGDAAAALLGETDLETAAKLVRAFSTYFHLANVTEQVHRGRELRSRRAAEGGLLAQTADLLKDGDPEHVRESVRNLNVRPVFTAHPTEAARRSVLNKLRRIAELLEDGHADGAGSSGDRRRADLRLAEEGERLGLLSAAQASQARVRRERVAGELARLRAARVNPDRETLAVLAAAGIAGFEQPCTLAELLTRPELGWARLTRALGRQVAGLERADVEEIEAELKYAGYARRSARDRARVAGQMDWPIPADFVYRGLAGVSAEIQERLGAARPGTLGQAAQVPGVTPAALGILAIHVARARRQEAGCA